MGEGGASAVTHLFTTQPVSTASCHDHPPANPHPLLLLVLEFKARAFYWQSAASVPRRPANLHLRAAFVRPLHFPCVPHLPRS